MIRSTKAHYRAMTVQKFTEAIDAKKPLPNITILDAMNLLVAAWDRVSKETVQNCFRKAGLSQETQESAINDDDDPFKALLEEIGNLRERDPDLVQNGVTADDVLAAHSEVITSDNLPPNDQQILNEFRQIPSTADEEDEEEGEIQIEEEPPKRPPKVLSEMQQACCLHQVCFWRMRKMRNGSDDER